MAYGWLSTFQTSGASSGSSRTANLADLYGVETRRLNEQVKRNLARFPDDFMFQLTREEKGEVVANCDMCLSTEKLTTVLTEKLTTPITSSLRSRSDASCSA